MCYPKPGPRCSAHARNKYIKAKAAARRDRNFDTHAAEREAEEEFYATPAGFRELKRLIARGENAKTNTAKLVHFKQVRADQLAAINAKDEGDIQHEYLTPKKVKNIESIPLPDLEIPRKSWKVCPPEEVEKRETEYIDDSSEWVDKLSPHELAAVRWMTSNGFHEMGQLDRGETFQKYSGVEETQEETAARIKRMSRTLTKALAKAPEKPRIVYRGISAHSTPNSLLKSIPNPNGYGTVEQYKTEEEWEAAQTQYLDSIVEKGTISFNRPISTSEDPAVGIRFAGGQYAPDIMYEISAKKGAAVAVASAWGASESEVVLPAKTQYKVMGYKKDVVIKSHTTFRNKGEYDNHITIIQLQEM